MVDVVDLLTACKNGNNELAMALMQPPDYTKTDIEGNTALMLACINKMPTVALIIMDQLKQNGGQINQVNNNGNTAFLLACCYSMSEVALKMIDVFGAQGCRPEQVNNAGETAFIWVCYKSMTEVVLKMIDVFGAQGCKPEHVNNGGCNALIWACDKSMTEVVLKMIDVFGAQGCKPEQVSIKGNTALILACYNNMSEVALRMINVFGINSCKPKQVNNIGKTAFKWAIKNNMTEVISRLLQLHYASHFIVTSDTAIINSRNDIICDICSSSNYKLLYELLTTYSNVLCHDRLNFMHKIFSTKPASAIVSDYYLTKCTMFLYNNDLTNVSSNAIDYVRNQLLINRQEKAAYIIKLRLLKNTAFNDILLMTDLYQSIVEFIYTDYEPEGRGRGLCI